MVLDALVRHGETDFGLGLSGGRLAPALFRELVRQSQQRQCALQAVDFFWADERCVKPDDPDSNYRAARETLLAPLRIPAERVHRLLGEMPPDQAVVRAIADWEKWGRARGARGPRLDAVILGVGEDGHVASLFPENLPQDLASRAAFRAVVGPKPPPQRLTMGYPLLWEARLALIVITGPGKAEVVRRSISGSLDTPLGRVLRGRAGRETVVVTCPGEDAAG